MQFERGPRDDGLAAFVRRGEELDRFLRLWNVRFIFSARQRSRAKRKVCAPDDGGRIEAGELGERRIDFRDMAVFGVAQAHGDGALAERVEQVRRLRLGLQGQSVQRPLQQLQALAHFVVRWGFLGELHGRGAPEQARVAERERDDDQQVEKRQTQQKGVEKGTASVPEYTGGGQVDGEQLPTGQQGEAD
ncbi:MAG: hypothetical protein P8Y78_04860 [Acidihalobacter sp.]